MFIVADLVSLIWVIRENMKMTYIRFHDLVWEWVSVPTDCPHEVIVTLLAHQQHTTYNVNKNQ